ncbi:hypothetical protein [Methylobacterium planeticum]|uniref:Uncharacterized protein n=1 Tax=Methylobacterium planeticum TaxID=2615211 RepID=A0A6N6MVN6_9HYPH|nr:hypothetical protein [Methylobacterium planeticum]KAB1075222.1 hypothetical protein F6X51_04855 [Methylobacterium planeticum]
MRRLLSGGIKAILAIAALSTAAHWAMRVQRAPGQPAPAIAALPDPVTTGSIEPRRVEAPEAPRAEVVTRGLDQSHLSALIASTTADKPKAQKAVAKR